MLKEHQVLGCLCQNKNESKLLADSDWGACVETENPVTRYIIMFWDAVISWKSKKQSTITRSSAELEFRSMATIVAEIVWLKGLFKDLG